MLKDQFRDHLEAMQEVVAKMDDTLNQLRDHQQGAIAITRSSPFADDGRPHILMIPLAFTHRHELGVRYHHIDHERDARGRRNCSTHGRVQILNDKAVVFPIGIRPGKVLLKRPAIFLSSFMNSTNTKLYA